MRQRDKSGPESDPPDKVDFMIDERPREEFTNPLAIRRAQPIIGVMST